MKVRVSISQTDRTSSSADISIESVTQPTYQANCREVCRRDSSQLKYVSNKLLDMDIHNWQYDCSSQNPFSNASLNKVITLNTSTGSHSRLVHVPWLCESRHLPSASLYLAITHCSAHRPRTSTAPRLAADMKQNAVSMSLPCLH